jgi:transposase
MNPFSLTERESGDLESLLQFPASREHRRAQALLWLTQGFPAEEVAGLLDVSRQTVYNWATRFRQREGLDLFARLADATRPGRPPTGLGVIDPLVAAVFDQDPRELGFHATVWTAPLLCQYLQRAHDLDVSRKTVSRAIDRLGLSWKRPRHQLALRPDTWRQSKGAQTRPAGPRAHGLADAR